MKVSAKCLQRKILEYEDLPILLISIMFGFIVSLARVAGDDMLWHDYIGKSIIACWNWAAEQYFYWSSRQLVNFIWAIVLEGGRFVWMIYMTISMFVMLKALMLLSGETCKNMGFYVIGLVMTFPFETLMSAGWIATTTSYFGPQAFAIMALVPIKKRVSGDRIKIISFLGYCVALIYGANAEQMCVVLLGSYFVANIYLFIKRRIDIQTIILFLLSLLSMIYMMTCPGNWVRDSEEIAKWFPTYGMLDIIDKAEIGISTTLRWMYASGQTFVIVTCLVMAYIVWQKYKEPMFRFLALIPSGLILLMGPFRSVLTILFPYASYSANEVDYYGDFTVASSGRGVGTVHFVVLMLISVCICELIFLVNDTIEGIIGDITLIVLGVASRAMMGFSPTVYASNLRTFTTLIFCLMAVSTRAYARNIELFMPIKEKERYIWLSFVVLGFLNLTFLVVTAFY